MLYLVLMVVGSWAIEDAPPRPPLFPQPGAAVRPEPLAAFRKLLKGRILLASIKGGMTKEQVHHVLGDPPESKSFEGVMSDFYPDLGVIVGYTPCKTFYEGVSEWRVSSTRWLDCGRDNPFFWLVQ